MRDKAILLLVSLSVFLAAVCVALILLRSGIGQNIEGYITSYRANLGLSAYQRGSIVPILSFIPFALINLVITVLLSIRAYRMRRTLALTVLGLGILVLLLTIIASNALLTLY